MGDKREIAPRSAKDKKGDEVQEVLTKLEELNRSLDKGGPEAWRIVRRGRCTR